MRQFITPIGKSHNNKNQNKIFIKRDDLYPIAFGGNKARIAEKLVEDAQVKKCNHIVSYGSVSSNMNRAIASLCSVKQLCCTIICPKEDSLEDQTNNSRIACISEATVVECLKTNVAETVEQVCKDIRENGEKPYYIYGDKFGKGNEVTTSKVYIDVYNEIVEQEREMGVDFDYIFCATGTGMTQAGLIVGNHITEKKHCIVGISIARTKERELPILIEKVEKFHEIMDLKSFSSDEMILYDKVIGEGYGQINDALVETIKKELILDGIPLDITYTGKAFMGMLDYIEECNIRDKNILFIHTGGTPLFFDNLQAMIDFGEKDGR